MEELIQWIELLYPQITKWPYGIFNFVSRKIFGYGQPFKTASKVRRNNSFDPTNTSIFERSANAWQSGYQ